MNAVPEKKELSEQQKMLFTDALNDFSAFRLALIGESDRGCALFAAAYLDKALRGLLKSCLVASKKMEEEMFEGQSPLGSFSSRIKLAYYLGKIAKSERKDFDTIRSIRNEFAHNAELMRFDDQSIRDRCNNLTHNWREKEASARAKFCATVSMLMIRIMTERTIAIPYKEAEEQPLPDHIKQMGRAIRTELEKIIVANPTVGDSVDISISLPKDD